MNVFNVLVDRVLNAAKAVVTGVLIAVGPYVAEALTDLAESPDPLVALLAGVGSALLVYFVPNKNLA